MSDILLEIFPLEVIDVILLFMPKNALTSFYNILPEGSILVPVVISRLYKRTVVSELDELVKAATLATHIDKLSFTGKYELVMFLKENPSFISKVSFVDIKVWDEAEYSILKDIQFKRYSLELRGLESFDTSLIPQNLEKIILQFNYDHTLKPIKEWPRSLSKLRICNHQLLHHIELPNTLEELFCHGVNEVWHSFPPKLQKLTIECSNWVPSNELEFPDSLRELLIAYCRLPTVKRIVSKLPMKLRMLKLGENIGSKLSFLRFPDSIETLHLEQCGIETLEGFMFPKSLRELTLDYNRILNMQNLNYPESLVILRLSCNVIENLDCFDFPRLLRELYISENGLVSLDGVTFPELEVLDVSDTLREKTITSLKNAKLPSTLKVLRASGHDVKDWWQTELPEGLEVLEMKDRFHPERIRFPPSLEQLTLELLSSRKFNVSQLNLPQSLQTLEILNGRSDESFVWKLPNLQKMVLIDITGRVNVPQSVSHLRVRNESAEYLKCLKVSQRLDKCEIYCYRGEFDNDVFKFNDT